ncbi:hypothetical protein AB6F98_19285, partial [Proteus mirabilis]
MTIFLSYFSSLHALKTPLDRTHAYLSNLGSLRNQLSIPPLLEWAHRQFFMRNDTMRQLIAILGVAILAGCASNAPEQKPQPQTAPAENDKPARVSRELSMAW